ncbi:MAG: hypothetical protein LBO09_04915 [Candidatus Peribacteria bacterium]|jgi:hypothetical protein|nr:hypothetical protein [Candidatus Peribacteria bacterium]
MKFFFIAKEGKQDTKVRIFLEQACDNHNIPFIVVIPETFNYLQNTFESKDLVYRAGISASCKAIECQFLIQGGISFHKTLSR